MNRFRASVLLLILAAAVGRAAPVAEGGYEPDTGGPVVEFGSSETDIGGPVVEFRRSCGECALTDYCEFAHPGAPDGHVACVAHNDEDFPRLYRRYATAGVDYRPTGYYRPKSTFNSGLPSTINGVTIQYFPTGMSVADLAALHDYCVTKINQYRAGLFPFSDGTSDPGTPKPALSHLEGGNRCSSAQAIGDFLVNGQSGGCAGASNTFGSCPAGGSSAQNYCCVRSCSSLTACKSTLDGCLLQQWDTGKGQAANAAKTTANAFWHNMRNSAFTQVSCGFAWSTSNNVWMTQDFSASRASGVSQDCSCTSVGGSDGCGGTCVAY
ncbi:hypothetical protein DFJ74DRAFT_666612 [Hyaloraphidium curvatum]|nr:hypothetical protein DFJ74DRAFT_666612 [Hyaloraphidium curvatum]